jgi:hypothetical protein
LSCENFKALFLFILKLERDWNSWDDKPRTVEEHIEQYRESLVKPKEPEPVDEVETIDLFAVSVLAIQLRPREVKDTVL